MNIYVDFLLCTCVNKRIIIIKAIYDFLSMNNCNYMSIWHRFEDILTLKFRVIRLISLIRID